MCNDHEAGAKTGTFGGEDSGSGIPAHDLPHIFAPLYRGESARNRRTGGPGNTAAGGAVLMATLPASTAIIYDQPFASLTGTRP